ncbi:MULTISPECIES: type II toxin-antitoxin system HicB family antitoxin [unclassified Mycolicibacterium]|uniref:type II toxin-antitoxin system HicB family antitoxin n=1 Tax=unclassified Mycolicibacterium TaxID=2636767 RepID=UPI0012DDE920|nr:MULTISPECIES: type II toxin-antitoxin system HicB family antitoxin [unclassified Mycolicibacterium]MUL81628.1 type II toxin-antitoxin system HicB family antitoxin [Mycolicibacterium sp. CBMA 329]MUL87394.1 type II toxin-antitoxin system HicB family antitoxin [Mycolicibacterium sp. CBMA 331]MUL99740.1 type II toxin-antitoxin system HicB family antitoxin [Mycolicibacterium sp. CBMA 334]MUM25350.1 type II toxin-antitoxin system HicB family antitoxin [Mycolicibacterium sp. CBMA 295]MUM37691.1 t
MTEYTYRAQWSPDEGGYLGLCLEFPNLWANGLTPHEAIAAVEKKVAEELAIIRAADDTPPESLTDHRYSGKFMVRIPPTLHARLTVEAAEQRVSLNQWVVQKLAGRPSVSLGDLY